MIEIMQNTMEMSICNYFVVESVKKCMKKEYIEILNGIRQNTAKAEFLINKVTDYQDMLKQMREDQGWFGAPFIVKFANDKEFMIPSNYNLSIFKNIIESAIEIEMEKMTKELDEILCIQKETN